MQDTMIFNLKHYKTRLHIGTVIGTDYTRSEGTNADTIEIYYKENKVFIGRIVALLDSNFSNNYYDLLVYMD